MPVCQLVQDPSGVAVFPARISIGQVLVEVVLVYERVVKVLLAVVSTTEDSKVSNPPSVVSL